MERGSEENNNNQEISPSPTQRILKISTGDRSGENYIPVDITVEILKKLPSKSLVKFRCVSKQWSSIISYSKYFIDSIVTRSLIQPQRSHAIFRKKSSSSHVYFYIFSSTNPTIIKTESVSIPGSTMNAYNYVRGLITCWSVFDNSSLVSIYNPTTRQSLYLPELKPLENKRTCLFGYDPIEDQYKVLYQLELGLEQTWYVFTLRGQNQWRKIKGTRLHSPYQPTVCINGIIYYKATIIESAFTFVLMSFDVKSEKFDQVQTPETLMIKRSTLIDYQGKLGFVCCRMGMEIWVMDDVETKRWSKIFFCQMEGFDTWPILHVTRGGEIVFINEWDDKKTKILYYDPERNCMRCFEINNTIPEFQFFTKIFPDHVENTMSLN